MSAPVMRTRVDHNLYPELQRFGATDISACFNCGVCSAICPLSQDGASFPRRMARYAQLGQRDQLLASPELWACYGCAECTAACPTGADPATFMAAARRYAVASYDRTHLAYLLATSGRFALIFVVALVGLLAAFMYGVHQPVAGDNLAFFDFIPPDVVHNLGLGVMIMMGLAALAGFLEMLRRILGRPKPKVKLVGGHRVAGAFFEAVGRESLAQTRFRNECADDGEGRAWYRQRWFLHFATMWGFLGLLAATMADYGLELLGAKTVGAPEPLWEPVRLLGTLAGALLLYGSSYLIMRRLRGRDRAARISSNSDWTFLSMLWVAGLTGFGLELLLYLPAAPTLGYPLFLVHVAVAMALVLLLPFGKFAHAFYRPLALFLLKLRG